MKIEKRIKKTFISLIFVIISIFLGLWITKILLFHENKIERYGNLTNTKGIVILFHGIYGEDKDLGEITSFLEKEGYAGVNIQYPTTEGTIQEITEKYIAKEVDYYVKYLSKENTKRKSQGLPPLKINFVVHSLGSVVLRHYLKNNRLDNIGKVVFISPPSHGSQLADFPLSDVIRSTLGDAVSQFKTSPDSFVNLLGEPDYSCYVMIGNKSNNFLYSWIIPGTDDGMVPFSTARLKNCKYKTIDNTTHTSILKDSRTLNEIKSYLE